MASILLAPGFHYCVDGAPADLMAYFSCDENSTCNFLAGNTTVLCCPEGTDCSKVPLAPITCDLTQQDPSLHPDSPIKTAALSGKLVSCGDGCCPYGFSCIAERCRHDINQDVLPLTTPPISTVLVTTTLVTEFSHSSHTEVVTSSKTLRPTTFGSPIATNAGSTPLTVSPQLQQPSPVDHLKVIIPSAVAGLLVVTLSVIACVWLYRKRAAARTRRDTVVISEANTEGVEEKHQPGYQTVMPGSWELPAELPAELPTSSTYHR